MLQNTLLIAVILFGILDAVLMYLIILGGNMSKSQEEKQNEEDEEIDFLKKLRYNDTKMEGKRGKNLYK